MTSPPNPQHEPTMEEILASIRKIISEDQAEPAQSASPAPDTASAVDDVLELTQEVRSDGSVEEVAMETVEPEAAPMREARNFEPTESPRQTMADENHDDFISDAARNAVGRAFSAIEPQNTQQQEAPMQPGGNLDAAFERAVQNAFAPAIHDWIDGRSGEIMEQLKPLIRQWMDDNLPAIIENAVRNEVARAVRNRGR